METPTSFDLEAAVLAWRNALRGQLTANPEAERELEAHLRDSITDLGRRGLSQEEAFFLGTRRLGSISELNQEFTKADPSLIWRRRVFWMVAGYLLLRLWIHSSGPVLWTILVYLKSSAPVGAWMGAWLSAVLTLVPMAASWAAIRTGRFDWVGMDQAFAVSRIRFFGLLMLLAFGLFALSLFARVALSVFSPMHHLPDIVQTVRNEALASLLPSVMLCGFLAWLKPERSALPFKTERTP